MIRHGQKPYLECSSKGDKRFSAFYARIKKFNNKSIEEMYQASKVFQDEDSENVVSGLSIKEAKGKRATNQMECTMIYSMLWNIYIEENPELLSVLKQYNGLSDIFGQEGHCCQATELWRIRNE